MLEPHHANSELARAGLLSVYTSPGCSASPHPCAAPVTAGSQQASQGTAKRSAKDVGSPGGNQPPGKRADSGAARQADTAGTQQPTDVFEGRFDDAPGGPMSPQVGSCRPTGRRPESLLDNRKAVLRRGAPGAFAFGLISALGVPCCDVTALDEYCTSYGKHTWHSPMVNSSAT